MSRVVKKPTSATPGLNLPAPKQLTRLAICYANWTVPPAPSKNDGQAVFLFPGLEDDKDFVGDDHSACLRVEPRLPLSLEHRQLELLRDRHCV